MIKAYDHYISDMPNDFLHAVEQEQDKLGMKNEYLAFAYAFRNVTTKLVNNETQVKNLKEALTEKQLLHIIRTSLKIVYSSIGLKEIVALMEKIDDPVVSFWHTVYLVDPWKYAELYDRFRAIWNEIQLLEETPREVSLFDKLDVLMFLTANAFFIGNIEQMDVNISRAEALFAKNNSEDTRFLYYKGFHRTIMAFLFVQKGDAVLARKYIEEALECSHKINLPYLSAWVANNYGIVLLTENNTQEAIEQFQKSISYREYMGDIRGIGAVSNNLASVYNQLGLFEKAKTFYQKSIDYMIRGLGTVSRTALYANLARVYIPDGQLDKALEILEKGLSLEQKNDKPTIDLLYLLATKTRIALEMGDLTLAEELLVEIEAANKVLNNNPEKARHFYLLGVLRSKEANFGLARQFLTQAIDIALLDSSTTEILFNAQLELANIHLINYRNTGNDADLNKALSLIEIIIQFAREQTHQTLLCNVLIIRALFYELKGDVSSTRKDLKEAKTIADDIGLQKQQRQIDREIEALQKKRTQSEKTGGLVAYLKEAFRSMFSLSVSKAPTKKVTKIYGILLLDKDGLPIYNQYFGEKLRQNAVLASGLISAISNFAQELFSEENKGLLKSISHEDITILIEEIDTSGNLVVFADKDTYSLRSKLLQLIRDIKKQVDFSTVSPSKGLTVFDDLLESVIQSILKKNFRNYLGDEKALEL